MQILKPKQLDFLSSYLTFANNIGFKNQGIGKRLVAKTVRKELVSANSSRESLYEYLEDFAHINDPMFDLLLETLI